LKTRLKKTRQNKKIERGPDSIQNERAIAACDKSLSTNEHLATSSPLATNTKAAEFGGLVMCLMMR
jgi:hypothetical protein